jgi:hypothetical protein
VDEHSSAACEDSFLDDRGKALELAPDWIVAEQVGHRRSLPHWLFRALVVGAIGWAVFSFAGDPKMPTIGDVAFGVGLLVFGLVFRRLAPKPARPRLSQLAAQLVAHCRCGSCGYNLQNLERVSDGCVVCPECGAAWHSERFVLVGHDPKESALLQTLMSSGHVTHEESECDDRGLKLDAPIKWPPRWMGSGVTPADDLRRLRATMRGKLRRCLVVGVPATLVAWGGAVYLMTIPEREPFQVRLILVMTGLIAAISLYAAARIRLDREMLRIPVDDLGLCNNCGRVLPLEGPPGFDGCIVCTVCKRAWKQRISQQGNVKH